MGKGILETEDLIPIEPVIEGDVQSVPPVIRNETVAETSPTITTAAVITTSP